MSTTGISLFECEDEPLAFVRAGAPCPGKLLHHSRFRTADYEDFAEIIGNFLAECKAKGIEGTPTTGCFSCAGPVQPNNTVQMTNIQRWPEIDGDALAERYGISGGVKLINDFVAAGYGLLTLEPDDYIVLQEGDPQPNAPVACIGAGTGLGECYLTYDGQGIPTCWGSEGGHTEWAPRNEAEVGLQSFLKERYTPEGSKYVLSTSPHGYHPPSSPRVNVIVRQDLSRSLGCMASAEIVSLRNA
eukprot:COSAG02_NODE_9124_length_2322_cov_10.678363_2_plen_244_part_00